MIRSEGTIALEVLVIKLTTHLIPKMGRYIFDIGNARSSNSMLCNLDCFDDH